MATALAVFLVLLWLHNQVVTVKLVEMARKYVKDESAGREQVQQALQSRKNNETALVTTRTAPDAIVSPLSAANVTTTAGAHNITFSSESSVDTWSFHNTTRNATIVVHLSGEMGNHLSILAKALVVKLVAAERHGITAEIKLRHQPHPKWVKGRDAIQKCFPNLQNFNFTAANTDAFNDFSIEQDRLLVQNNWDPAKLRLDSDLDDRNAIGDALSYWKRIIESPFSFEINVNASVPVAFPFLTVASWCPLDMLDLYLSQIRSFLEFDKAACCRIKPDPDESVFVRATCSMHARSLVLLVILKFSL